MSSGTGSLNVESCDKFLQGVRDLVNLRLDRFNDRVKLREDELRSAVTNAEVQLALYICHSGADSLADHASRRIQDFLKEINSPVEVATWDYLNQDRLYRGLIEGAQGKLVDLEVRNVSIALRQPPLEFNVAPVR